jgi:malto-oligosyltrehalose trehalohydrolase
MNYAHQMPFGAEICNDGKVRFRLWAPKAAKVSVDLSAKTLPMPQLDQGWFELITGEARPGTRYQFKIDHLHSVPDPASRYQPLGVHGPSEVIAPKTFEWKNISWGGRPWEEAVVYELHVGTFSPEGTFAGVEQRLDYLVDLGITAAELMPVAAFPGTRNWGYDGVLPYAPAACYGRPQDLKHLVDAAHSKGLMVFLDVVYNHFGPEGNYLHVYSPQFFSERHRTPWGEALNFDGSGSRQVRDYFIHNALYWLEEYCFDGLRIDAVHAICDSSHPDFITELAETIRTRVGHGRRVHLVLENHSNEAHYLGGDVRDKPGRCTAQWNDDIHHAAHVLLTRESDGYYQDYADDPATHLARCLTEGYSFQGQPSSYQNGRARGEPSRDLPLSCFVSFLQNHDQVGNRALGERITGLTDAAEIKAALAVLLLAPSPPLLFMGEEFGASTPFLFFSDFGPDLADKVREGRREEFSRFAQFRSQQARTTIPDPNSEDTFLRSKLDWDSLELGPHARWLHLYRQLLAFRQREIVPRVKNLPPGKAEFAVFGNKAISIVWALSGGDALLLMANFGDDKVDIPQFSGGRLLYTTADDGAWLQNKKMPPLCAAWFLRP